MISVLHVIPSMAVSYGGPSHALGQMQDVFKKLGVSSTIVAVQDPEVGDLTIQPSSALILFPKQFPAFYFYSEPLRAWLRDHIRDYDLVHIHSLFSFPAFIAGHYARQFRIPYILRPFGTLDKYCMRRNYFRKRIYFELFERNSLNGADAIHCTSVSEKEEIERFKLQKECAVISLGIQNAADLPSLGVGFKKADEIKSLLFLSRIDPKKGLEVLIQAIKMLKAERKDFCLRIAGSGNKAYVANIKERVRKAGLENKILFVGEVRDERKKEMLESADIFILPSHRENFGLAVAEAMAAGCPVIVSDQVAIHKDISEFGAGLVVSLKSKEISKAIGQLLNDKTARLKMGERGQMLVKERFDLEQNVKKLIDFYSKIISEKQNL